MSPSVDRHAVPGAPKVIAHTGLAGPGGLIVEWHGGTAAPFLERVRRSPSAGTASKTASGDRHWVFKKILGPSGSRHVTEVPGINARKPQPLSR